MIQEQTLSTADLAGRGAAAAADHRSEQELPGRVSLFPENELGDFRRRWQDVQSGFVDDPRTAVKTADELVASIMTRLAQVFSDERGKLEHDWDKGENVSTEDLRLALQRYRSFFDRLLSV
jgi:carotenoid cleavage dioxygenase-like enzyme